MAGWFQANEDVNQQRLNQYEYRLNQQRMDRLEKRLDQQP
jgi:hypothetical protein